MKETLSIAELIKKKFPAGEFIIGGGLLNRGAVMVVGGPPKSYKSIIINTILCSLATGQALFNATRAVREKREEAFPIDSGYSVLYLEQEIGEHDLQQRYLQSTIDLSKEAQILIGDLIQIHSCDHSLRLDTPEGFRIIDEIIREQAPEVVCFDPLVEFHGQDENSSHGMMKVLRSLDDLREKYGFSTILVHHTSKLNGDHERKGPDRLRGSSVLFGKADTIMIIDTDPKIEGMVKAEFTLRRGKPIADCFLRVNQKTLRTEFMWWANDPLLKDKRGRMLKKPPPNVLEMGAQK